MNQISEQRATLARCRFFFYLKNISTPDDVNEVRAMSDFEYIVQNQQFLRTTLSIYSSSIISLFVDKFSKNISKQFDI